MNVFSELQAPLKRSATYSSYLGKYCMYAREKEK